MTETIATLPRFWKLVLLTAAIALTATAASAQSGPYSFFAVNPCRVVDTRNPTSTNGGPALDLNNVKANSLPFLSIKSTNSPTTGFALNSLLGSFSAGSGSSISGVTSAAGVNSRRQGEAGQVHGEDWPRSNQQHREPQ